MDNNNQKFEIDFSPAPILKEAEDQILATFRRRVSHSIESFFSTYVRHERREGQYVPVKEQGPGALLIDQWLEKKFDDPKTIKKMDHYFEANFERLMSEALEKVIRHRVNGKAFKKLADE